MSDETLLQMWEKDQLRSFYYRQNPLHMKPHYLARIIARESQQKIYRLYHWAKGGWQPAGEFDTLSAAMLAWELAYG